MIQVLLGVTVLALFASDRSKVLSPTQKNRTILVDEPENIVVLLTLDKLRILSTESIHTI